VIRRDVFQTFFKAKAGAFEAFSSLFFPKKQPLLITYLREKFCDHSKNQHQ